MKGNVGVVVGLAFGDEGKARIVDYLNESYDIGVRFNGSNNSGHTVIVNDKKTVFHLLPAMALRGKPCVLSPGVLINTLSLENEIRENGISLNNVMVDYRCPVITKEQITEDKLTGGKIGTTGKGVGPCVRDHVARIGKRYEDFWNSRKDLDYYVYLPQPIDTRKYLYESIKNGKNVLFEGAQAYQLDIFWGSYPYVTSRCTLSGAVTTLAGIPYNMIDKVYGVFKCYTTRVGNGPFDTEIEKEDYAELIRQRGNEYGATTGRPRRIGWLNLPMLKEACETNGVTDLCMTKADVLDTRLMGESGRMAVYYGNMKDSQRKWKTYSSGLWGNLSEIKKKEDLPANFRELLADIELFCEVPITMISLGPERDNIIHL